MNLVMRQRALNAIAKVADWIDEKNTRGAGSRWVQGTYDDLNHLAAIKVKHTICKDPSLARYSYRCFTHKNKWVVAYQVKGDKSIVYRFIYGPWLDYI